MKDFRKLYFLALFTSVLALHSSCILQYNTAETNASLKSSVANVEANCTSITKQVADMQKEYLTLNCKTEMEPFQTAQKLLEDVNSSVAEINKVKTEVNKEFANFSEYSKGKKTIASNTPEWDNLKQTRKKMKDYVKSLEKMGEETLKKATTFNVYATTSVVPSIQLCDVKNYMLKYDQTMASFVKSQETAYSDFKKYQEEIKNATSKYRNSQAIKIQTLAISLQSMEAEIDKLESIKIAIVKAVNQFKVETRGKQKIYSCSPDWEIMLRVESAIAAEQKEIQNVQSKLVEIAAQIQNTVNTLE
jgi:hypothetical protein